MNISYDIFELADCPVIVTDKNFVISYKNGLAAKLFCGFRRRSKISRYFRNFKNDVDFSSINELDIETGTQFMRALVLPIGENDLAFLFFTLFAFTNDKKFLSYVRENYSGCFMDFYCTACREYIELQANEFSKCNIRERAYSELLTLTSFLLEKPVFMQTESYNISKILEAIVSKAEKRLPAFGLKATSAEILEKDCYAKINIRIFCFVIFRMLYMAFRLSDTGGIKISLDTPRYSYIEICVSASVNKLSPLLAEKSGDFTSLVEIFPEFSFEFDIFKRTGVLDNMLSYSLHNSNLKLHYIIERETNISLTLRSYSEEMQLEQIEHAIKTALIQIKKLLPS